MMLDVEPIIRNDAKLRLKFFKCPKSNKTTHAKTCIESCEVYPICEKLAEIVNTHRSGGFDAIHRKNKRSKR